MIKHYNRTFLILDFAKGTVNAQLSSKRRESFIYEYQIRILQMI